MSISRFIFPKIKSPISLGYRVHCKIEYSIIGMVRCRRTDDVMQQWRKAQTANTIHKARP